MSGVNTFAPPPHPDDPWAADSSPLDPPSPFAAPARRRRSKTTVIWTVVGAALVAIGGGIAWDVTATAREQSVVPAERGFTGTLNGVQVVAGMCLVDADLEASTVGKVTSVSCADPHRAEAVAAYTYAESPWPGSERVAGEAETFCAAQVGRALERAVLTATWTVWAPSQDTWAAGDREALCVMVTDRDVIGAFESGTVTPA